MIVGISIENYFEKLPIMLQLVEHRIEAVHEWIREKLEIKHLEQEKLIKKKKNKENTLCTEFSSLERKPCRNI